MCAEQQGWAAVPARQARFDLGEGSISQNSSPASLLARRVGALWSDKSGSPNLGRMSSLEIVALTPDSVDVLWGGWIILDLLSELVDVLPDQKGLADPLGAPYLCQYRIVTQHAPRMADQHLQNAELEWAEIDRSVFDRQLVSIAVEHDVRRRKKPRHLARGRIR
jgi:hypothetical protein